MVVLNTPYKHVVLDKAFYFRPKVNVLIIFLNATIPYVLGLFESPRSKAMVLMLLVVSPALAGRLRPARFRPSVCPCVRPSVNLYPGPLVSAPPHSFVPNDLKNVFFIVCGCLWCLDIIVRSVFVNYFLIVNYAILQLQYI